MALSVNNHNRRPSHLYLSLQYVHVLYTGKILLHVLFFPLLIWSIWVYLKLDEFKLKSCWITISYSFGLCWIKNGIQLCTSEVGWKNTVYSIYYPLSVWLSLPVCHDLLAIYWCWWQSHPQALPRPSESVPRRSDWSADPRSSAGLSGAAGRPSIQPLCCFHLGKRRGYKSLTFQIMCTLCI